MEEKKQLTPSSVGIRFGLFCVLGLLGISLVTGSTVNFGLGILPFLIVALFILLGHRYYKQHGSGYMTFGQGFSIGGILVLVSSVIFSMFSYLSFTLLSLQDVAEMKEFFLKDMEENGSSDAELDQFAELLDIALVPEIIAISTFVMFSLFGLILSLIIAAINKKENPVLDY